MEDEERKVIRKPGGGVVVKPVPAPKPTRGSDDQRRRGRLTVTSVTGDGEEERMRSVAAFKRRVQRLKGHQQVEQSEFVVVVSIDEHEVQRKPLLFELQKEVHRIERVVVSDLLEVLRPAGDSRWAALCPEGVGRVKS